MPTNNGTNKKIKIIIICSPQISIFSLFSLNLEKISQLEYLQRTSCKYFQFYKFFISVWKFWNWGGHVIITGDLMRLDSGHAWRDVSGLKIRQVMWKPRKYKSQIKKYLSGIESEIMSHDKWCHFWHKN